MRFGVLSTANIGVNVVIPAIKEAGHEVRAIASREKQRAKSVGSKLDIPQTYGSYTTLLENETIDAIYNPLPNALHAKWTKKAADNGLHVLCEKPLTVDAEEAREVASYCNERDVTLMEAFMWRYHPRTKRAKEITTEYFDDIRSVKATFQFPVTDPDNIRLQPELGGGSLMDVGCYAMNATRLFLGEPIEVYATTTDRRDTGVDTELTAILEYPDGATAQISSNFDTPEKQSYRIEATNGWLEVEEAFAVRSDRVSLTYHVNGRTVNEEFESTNQYRLEIEEFVSAITEDRDPETGPSEAIANMELIDALYESANKERPITVT